MLTAISYVDLNPIRTGIAETPGASEFTSIRQRIRLWQPESHISIERPAIRRKVLRHLLSYELDWSPLVVGLWDAQEIMGVPESRFRSRDLWLNGIVIFDERRGRPAVGGGCAAQCAGAAAVLWRA